MVPGFFFFSLIYLFMPFINSVLYEIPVFVNDYNKYIWYCGILPTFGFYLFNLVLFNSLNQYMYNKMFYAQTVYTMIDNQSRQSYEII